MPRDGDPAAVVEGEGGGRRLLEDLGRALALAREIRYEKPERFSDVTEHELDNAARALKAIAYSCTTGAMHLERVRAKRSS